MQVVSCSAVVLMLLSMFATILLSGRTLWFVNALCSCKSVIFVKSVFFVLANSLHVHFILYSCRLKIAEKLVGVLLFIIFVMSVFR